MYLLYGIGVTEYSVMFYGVPIAFTAGVRLALNMQYAAAANQSAVFGGPFAHVSRVASSDQAKRQPPVPHLINGERTLGTFGVY
jgi:hypothetical protein